MKTLLLPGWVMSKDLWKYQQFVGFEVATVPLDFPGQGENKELTKGTLEDFARFVRREISSEENYILCGWSMGASVVLKYQELFPNEADGLILVDTAPRYFVSEEYPLGLSSEFFEPIKKQLGENPQKLYNNFIPAMFKEEPTPERVNWIYGEMVKADLEVAMNSLVDFSKMDFLKILPQIQIPTLIIHGRADQIYPVEAAKFMDEQIPNTELRIFEDSGHCPQLEETERFNQELYSFVNKVKSCLGYKQGGK